MRTFVLLVVFVFSCLGAVAAPKEQVSCREFKAQIKPIYLSFDTNYGSGNWGFRAIDRKSHGMTGCIDAGTLGHFNHCAVMKHPMAAQEMLAILPVLDHFLGAQVGFSENLLGQAYQKFLSAQAAGYDVTGRDEATVGDYKLRFAAWPAIHGEPHEVCLMLTHKDW